MDLDADRCYQALTARDRRFDGRFFVGVTSTQIYCRPICPARTPARRRCRFFRSAAAAQRAGFRPCLRCCPELAPGLAPVDATRRVATLAAQRIEAGALTHRGVDGLAAEFGIGARQLRRAIEREFGVAPIDLAQTHRLLLAKRLLGESSLPITDIALASGFRSLRRFNAAFRDAYRAAPSQWRWQQGATKTEDALQLTLAYRPPLAWDELLRFLSGRSTAGVEQVEGDTYRRTVEIDGKRGWCALRHDPTAHRIQAMVAIELLPVLPALLARLRALLDLDADPAAIDGTLASDPWLAPRIAARPGLRVPGSVDGFELLLRAILGQQVSVAAATTIAGRFAQAFGGEIVTPFPALTRTPASAERIAQARIDRIAGLGVPRARAEAIRHVARALVAGRLSLAPHVDPQQTIEKLVELPGIGPWTAHYVAMRALRWPDAFPTGDLGLRRALGDIDAKAIAARAEVWRPWRSYAALHLWCGAAGG